MSKLRFLLVGLQIKAKVFEEVCCTDKVESFWGGLPINVRFWGRPAAVKN